MLHFTKHLKDYLHHIFVSLPDKKWYGAGLKILEIIFKSRLFIFQV